ncbi:sulfatase-like hydrolase/transferase [Mucilaginibacter sp. UYCu711]|uniref:sulfatase family protein n=1 Tax=Mucilaginibacter sp. UYCu711 TaxID=3156339 RepID=UPI003D1B9F1D
MKINYFAMAFAGLVGFGLAGSIACYGQAAKKQPNIVFILADDLGYGDLKKFNPNAQTSTPNIDRLATGGMMFTNAHSASSVCTPSRYGILTGRYAFRTSMKKGVLGGYSPALVEPDRFTIATLLKNAGYQTALIGKWHLGMDWKPIDPSKKAIQLNGPDGADLSNVDLNSPVVNGPNNHGFDYSYVLPASLDMTPYLYLENGKPDDLPLVPEQDVRTSRGVFWRGGLKAKNFKIENTLDHWVDKARGYITKASKETDHPFFLYLTLTAPHTPWLPAEKFKGTSGAGIYGDFVAHTDDAIGRVLRVLDSLKLTENTIVIFSSDNGADWKKTDLAEFPKHQANYIFRGEKSDIWDGGHHIPFIIRWPGGIAGNRSSNTTFCLVDMMATLADVTHQQLPKGAGPDSYDFWPLISQNKPVVRPSIIHHSNDGMFAIRKGKWKFIDGIGSGGWSAKDPQDSAPGQLYDMEQDERETTNVYNKYPDIVKELKELLELQKERGYSVGGVVK